MKIKVCGLNDPENIKSVAALNPDYMGFIYYGPSPRFIGGLAPVVLKALPATICKTAVFVNEDAETIDHLIDLFNFNAVQLHGSESPEFCDKFKNKVIVFKAFGIDENFDFGNLAPYSGKVDFFLFDTKTTIHGGSGRTFDWTLLDRYKLNTPFFLSGGLSPGNLEEVKGIEHPRFFGVDLNSKFEISPGQKNMVQLEEAFHVIKNNAYNELRS